MQTKTLQQTSRLKPHVFGRPQAPSLEAVYVAGERSHVCARRRAKEARGAEGLRPLRGLWRRRLPPGDGGDADVVWDASTGAVRPSFWRATVDEVRFVPKSVPAAPCSPSASCSRFG